MERRLTHLALPRLRMRPSQLSMVACSADSAKRGQQALAVDGIDRIDKALGRGQKFVLLQAERSCGSLH